LVVLDRLGGGSQTLLAITRRQPQRVDHGVRRGANLVDRDLRIFPP
jgi:N-acetylglucosamine kinase-like BadF-type ATPase